MDEPAHDERLRHLQRIAYGAVTSSAERAAALAELDAMRREQAHVDAEAADAPPPADPSWPVQEKTPTGSTRAVSEWIAASDAASVRRFRWAVAAGTAALLVGIAVGWQLGTRTAGPGAAGAVDQALGASASIAAGTPDGFALPVVESPAYDVFDRPTQPTDAPPPIVQEDWADGWLDTSTLRLLATTADGVGVYGAKAVPGGRSADIGPDDVCLVVVRSGGTGGTCTQQGVFRDGELWTDVSIEGDGRVRAEWHADGTVLVSVPTG
ncbi:hypothetical protein EV187_3649 [Agromyces ramosus]|uniref:Uncharacterized protein n=1 Tax=Agromyces ramosus TaxID=33879 RepID=A0A4Q7M6L8_9MICO|nr:hypothetical protein [Agromyces ramosus]RZS63334.1 hypothetical protein EV187_3649 [Agromyces ramosus]